MNHIWMLPAHKHNFEVGRRDNKITSVVFRLLVGTLEDADIAFTSENRLASAHYGIYNDIVHKYVDEGNTAFHTNPYDKNLTSIGIVIGKAPGPVSNETYQTISKLLSEIVRKYRIILDLEHIVVNQQELPEEEKINIQRIINDTKELSPQTTLEKARFEREKFEKLYNEELTKNNIIQAEHTGEIESFKKIITNLNTFNTNLSVDVIMKKKEIENLVKDLIKEKSLFSIAYKEYYILRKELEKEKKKSIFTVIKEKITGNVY